MRQKNREKNQHTTVAEKGEVTCPRSSSRSIAELKTELTFSVNSQHKYSVS